MRVSIAFILSCLVFVVSASAQETRERRPLTAHVTGFVTEETEALQSDVIERHGYYAVRERQ